MSRTQLSVVVPTHMRSESLSRLLGSLEEQDLPRDSFEVVVVSNLDDRAARTLAEEFLARGLSVAVHVAGVIGVNKARNLGIEHSRGEILYFLDDDCRLGRRDHLRVLIQKFTDDTRFALRGGPYLSPHEAGREVRAYNALVNAWVAGRDLDRPLLPGGNLAVRRSAIGEIRFDEAITYGGSEVSFQLRLLVEGQRSMFDADLGVEHEPGGRLASYAIKAWKQGRTKHDWGAMSALESLSVLSRENLETILFGVAYGGISRAAWATSAIARRLSFR